MKKLFLILCSLFLMVNCSDDDKTSMTNVMSYNNEDIPIKYLEAKQVGDNLLITGANDDDHGFIIEFRDKTIETLDGVYTFNDDDEYNPVTDFSGAFLNNSTGAHVVTSGQVTVDDVDGTNITLSFVVNADGISATGVYVGDYTE